MALSIVFMYTYTLFLPFRCNFSISTCWIFKSVECQTRNVETFRTDATKMAANLFETVQFAVSVYVSHMRRYSFNITFIYDEINLLHSQHWRVRAGMIIVTWRNDLRGGCGRCIYRQYFLRQFIYSYCCEHKSKMVAKLPIQRRKVDGNL